MDVNAVKEAVAGSTECARVGSRRRCSDAFAKMTASRP